jgi:hypothetical protein
MTNSTTRDDRQEPIGLPPLARERLEAAALRILRSRHGYVRLVEASDN